MKPLDRLAKNQINRRLKALRMHSQDTKVQPGWVKYMRRALGITLKQLAKQTGVSISTIAHIERSEAAGTASLNTLKKIAAAMECELVYAFVLKDDLETALKKAARKKARQILAIADTHMTLEDQRVEQSRQERIERLADELIQKGNIW